MFSRQMRKSIVTGAQAPEEFQKQLAEFLRQQFPRDGAPAFARAESDTRYLFEVRVAGILLVEPAQRRFESLGVPGPECLSHCLGLIAKVRYARKQ